MRITPSFQDEIRKFNKPLFLLASETGFHPSQLSRILNGQSVKRVWDIRFKLLAEKIGFDGELFEAREKQTA